MNLKILFNILIAFIYCLSPIKASDGSENVFYFVRHGITDWSMDKLLEGPQDLPLNAEGIADIAKLSTTFRSLSSDQPTSILYSKFRRCKETMEILSEGLGIIKTQEFAGLEEVYRGDWSKLDGDTKNIANHLLIEKNYIGLEAIVVPDAEKWDSFIVRSENAILGCLQYDQKSPIVVTHGQVVKTFLKRKGCWSDSIEAKWKGDYRAPIKVTYKTDYYKAELIED